MDGTVVSVTISTLQMQSLGYSPNDGVEKYFLGMLGDRALLELESMEEQLDLLESLDDDLFLAYSLDSIDELDQYAQQMVESWYCGREQGLVDLILEGQSATQPGSAEIMQRMFYDRNVTMADGIEQLLGTEGDHFVVVGAGHVVGDRGIPAELASRGIEVVRVD